MLEWDFYVSGQLSYISTYTYLRRQKNPNLARPGLDYSFAYVNGGWDQNRWYSTSEKDVSYDEEGNPFVEVDQDPVKTVAAVNSHNYVTVSDFFDILTQEYVHFRFEYENCGGDDNDRSASALKSPVLNSHKMSLARFLKPGSRQSIKVQVKEFRKQW